MWACKSCLPELPPPETGRPFHPRQWSWWGKSPENKKLNKNWLNRMSRMRQLAIHEETGRLPGDDVSPAWLLPDGQGEVQPGRGSAQAGVQHVWGHGSSSSSLRPVTQCRLHLNLLCNVLTSENDCRVSPPLSTSYTTFSNLQVFLLNLNKAFLCVCFFVLVWTFWMLLLRIFTSDLPLL